ncbi:MAG: hypothetical protein AB7P33_17855 [Dehalococcoidia bacterium]
MIEIEPNDPVMLIAAAWQEAGRRAPTPVPVGQDTCMVPGCSEAGWVRLKTYHGPIVCCFNHFQSVRGLAL